MGLHIHVYVFLPEAVTKSNIMPWITLLSLEKVEYNNFIMTTLRTLKQVLEEIRQQKISPWIEHLYV